MTDKTYRLYGYRWVVLAVFMLINLTIQLLWISYAPITGPAAAFYGVDDLKIGMLSMTFMLAFLPLSIPVSWAIDTYGFRLAVSVGAILMGVFSILRGLAGTNYNLVLISTIGIAAAQPFLLNAWTKLPAQWFSMEERATAVGLITLANLLGAALGMLITPMLIETLSISTVQLYYGAVTAVTVVLFILLAREKPATPPCPPGQEVRALMLDGLKHALRIREFWLYLAVFFVALGIFNGISTWVENIIRPRGFSPADAGTLGAIIVVGGIIGAVVLPPISDRMHKRQPFILAGFVTAIPALLGVTFAMTPWLLFTSAFILGFSLVSVAPIGMQYAAEITYPTPEGTSNGLIQLAGQASVVFVYLMEILRSRNGAFTPALLMAMVLLILSSGLILRMKEPATVLNQETPQPAET
jgi:MFS family permease